jgi:hypothetical protein
MNGVDMHADLKIEGTDLSETLKRAIGRIAILKFVFEMSESVDFDRLVPDVCRGTSEILSNTLSELEDLSQVLETFVKEFKQVRAKARHYDALLRAKRIPREYSYEYIRDSNLARLKRDLREIPTKPE